MGRTFVTLTLGLVCTVAAAGCKHRPSRVDYGDHACRDVLGPTKAPLKEQAPPPKKVPLTQQTETPAKAPVPARTVSLPTANAVPAPTYSAPAPAVPPLASSVPPPRYSAPVYGSPMYRATTPVPAPRTAAKPTAVLPTPAVLPKVALPAAVVPPPLVAPRSDDNAIKNLIQEELRSRTPVNDVKPMPIPTPTLAAPKQTTTTTLSNGDKLIELNSKTTTTSNGKTIYTLSGEVQQFRRTWRLRYAPLDSDDPHGGSVCLEGTGVEGLNEGQRIRVTGAYVPAEDRQSPTRFQVQRLEVLTP